MTESFARSIPNRNNSMTKLVTYKKYAVGYDIFPDISFVNMITPYLQTIKEIFFSWPGMISGRELKKNELSLEQEKKKIVADLQWCRAHGLQMDLLFNANCYGENAYGEELRYEVYGILDELEANGLFPEIVTTTSQFIAKVIKKRHPQIDIRASVNMRIESTKSMEFISDLFDSFYICRDIQRDLNIVKRFYEWSEKHGKKMCMLVNSGCLRCCPVQIFHDNFICHGSWRGEEQEFILRYPYRLCERHFKRTDHLVDYLRMSWIRPEDMHWYEPFVSTIKLATRRTEHPDRIIRAYSEGAYDGDLLDLIVAAHPKIILRNRDFPADWIESGIAQSCALNCTECGKCDAVLKQILEKRGFDHPVYSINQSKPKIQ